MNGRKTMMRFALISAALLAGGDLFSMHRQEIIRHVGFQVDQNGDSKQDDSRTVSIVGKWYLTAFVEDESKIPDHRVELIFYADGKGYRGAVLLINGKEDPLAAVQFDGVTLRFQMTAPAGKPQAEMPWFVATLVNGRFGGFYFNSANAPMGPKLKLVRLEK
jgi:hypothetical protein